MAAHHRGQQLSDRIIGMDERRRPPPSSSGGSSGSEHSADECLSEMVLDFFEDGGCRSASPPEEFSGAAAADCTEAVGEICSLAAVNSGDNVEPYRELLVANVLEAAEMAAAPDGAVSRRRLMMILRELHHNAAICKTKWGSFHGLAAGDYEFVDVVVDGNIRYLIDANFPTQFEIARPTIQYSELLKSLPRVFVGTAEELKRILRIMCDAAKRSLNRTDLSVPPWRKNSYMQKKWLGPYRRTVNPASDKSPVQENTPGCWPVKSRWIGFDVVAADDEVNDRDFVCARSIKAI